MEQPIALSAPSGISLAASAHPKRRDIARSLDLTVYGVLGFAIQTLVLHWRIDRIPFASVIEPYIALALMLLIEPVLLCTVGTTPGKWILGFRLRNANGDKLTYREALKRTWLVFGKGFGYGIPLYDLVRMVDSSQKLANGETLGWEGEETYSLVDLRKIRSWCVVFANCLCLALVGVIFLRSELPLHRGDLTPSQYAANCTELFSRSDAYYLAMDSKGVMDANGVIMQKSTPGEYAVDIFDIELPRHEMTVENGFVKGVRLYYRGRWPGEDAMRRQIEVAYVAFVGAQKGANAFLLSEMANNWAENLRTKSEGQEFGVRIKSEFKDLGNEQIEILFAMEKE